VARKGAPPAYDNFAVEQYGRLLLSMLGDVGDEGVEFIVAPSQGKMRAALWKRYPAADVGSGRSGAGANGSRRSGSKLSGSHPGSSRK
jgi:hypothetical protein